MPVSNPVSNSVGAAPRRLKSCMTSVRSAGVMELQTAISSMLRRQPLHSRVPGSISQTWMHGDSIVVTRRADTLLAMKDLYKRLSFKPIPNTRRKASQRA